MRTACALAAAVALTAAPCHAADSSRPRYQDVVGLSANLGAAVGGGYLTWVGLGLGPPGMVLTVAGSLVCLRGAYGTIKIAANLEDGGARPTSILVAIAERALPGRAWPRRLAIGADVALDVSLIWAIPEFGLAGQRWMIWPAGKLWAGAEILIAKSAYEFGRVSSTIGWLDITNNALEMRAPRARAKLERPTVPTAPVRIPVPVVPARAETPPLTACPADHWRDANGQCLHIAAAVTPAAAMPSEKAPLAACPADHWRDANGYCHETARAATPTATARVPPPAPPPVIIKREPRDTYDPDRGAGVPGSLPQPTNFGPGSGLKTR